eukprot:CAMPEP_0181361858 /NCGR_PEP_ID=MMETSP1106-20121128/7602_1 /TAXON_ID=81844 /ORGANISM="Mantoniella antarctica, Strain SL-175" /LENGTH=162 /DNA_ID=CAMNT_0023475583 /DNA_START=14 /DNA_END=498 /DNA_ORIENTATION=+
MTAAVAGDGGKGIWIGWAEEGEGGILDLMTSPPSCSCPVAFAEKEEVVRIPPASSPALAVGWGRNATLCGTTANTGGSSLSRMVTTEEASSGVFGAGFMLVVTETSDVAPLALNVMVVRPKNVLGSSFSSCTLLSALSCCTSIAAEMSSSSAEGGKCDSRSA